MITSRTRRNLIENGMHAFLFLSALLSILTTFGILYVLLSESFAFFRHVSVLEFFTGKEWYPLFHPPRFGVLPLICGTLLVAVGAGVVSIPIGLFTGIYLSEYASDRVRAILKPVLEILAGVPTVVYGFFALTFVTPMLQKFNPGIPIFNVASAAIVVGIMTLPMVASLCDDAMKSVPNALRYGAYALGGTKLDVSVRVVLPGAFSGVIASFVLAISRAIGETMAVTLAAGATPNLTWNIFESVQTMTAFIVQVSLGDTPANSIEYQTIFAVGMTLFLITFGMNVLSQWILGRFQERYE